MALHDSGRYWWWFVWFLEEWTVKQCLVSVQFLQKSVNGDELARLIISVLSVSLGVESGRLLAVMRDGASEMQLPCVQLLLCTLPSWMCVASPTHLIWSETSLRYLL